MQGFRDPAKNQTQGAPIIKELSLGSWKRSLDPSPHPLLVTLGSRPGLREASCPCQGLEE